ncbi:unnamed protein product [Staurois parvus]|uniref:Uncharacterized protein n=1 Tax=Staurois parvus TaxID=386267 RepID=A0ABN9HEE9_9NEOB|nr:unnamed protein product [Staurois parvus]
MVGSQARDQNRRSQQRSGSNRSATRQEQECRNKIQGPGKTHTKAESAGLAIP